MLNSNLKNNSKKFNIFLGEFLNKLSNSPTIHNISKELFSIKKKDYILINDNLSLPELSQQLLDDIVFNKDEILEVLVKLFSKKSRYNNNFHKQLLDSNLFSSIISSNYDTIFEDYFFDQINKSTPFLVNNDELDKVSFYKLYGDLESSHNFILSTQDIKRLKILDFYSPFWRKIYNDLCKYPSILFGINFNDTSFIGLLDFIFSKIKDKHQTIYIYIDTSIKSKSFEDFINKYSINIIEGSYDNFFENVKNYFPDLNILLKEGDAPLLDYA